MKSSLLLLCPLLALSSCKKEEAPPVAVVPVVPAVPDNSIRPDGTPREEVRLSDPPAPPLTAIPVPEEIPPTVDVDEEEPVPRTPGEHVDRAIQKTDEGVRKAADATGRFLQRAGEKIEEEAHRPRPAGE